MCANKAKEMSYDISMDYTKLLKESGKKKKTKKKTTKKVLFNKIDPPHKHLSPYLSLFWFTFEY